MRPYYIDATEFNTSEIMMKMRVQCCVCKKVRRGATWIRVTESTLSGARVSHGYCPKCAKQAFEELEKLDKLRSSPALASTRVAAS